jgi:hypothetical protein
LIGDAHSLRDGHHKEYVLVDVFTRSSPRPGFMVSRMQQNECTTEQDIHVIDSTVEAPHFRIPWSRRCQSRAPSAKQKSPTLVQVSLQCCEWRSRRSISVALRRVLLCHAIFPSGTVASHLATQIHAHCERYFTSATQSPRHLFEPATGPVFIAEPDHTNEHGYRLRCYDCGTLPTTFSLADLLEHLAMRRGSADTTLSLAAEVVGMSTEQAGTVRQLTFEGHKS